MSNNEVDKTKCLWNWKSECQSCSAEFMNIVRDLCVVPELQNENRLDYLERQIKKHICADYPNNSPCALVFILGTFSLVMQYPEICLAPETKDAIDTIIHKLCGICPGD